MSRDLLPVVDWSERSPTLAADRYQQDKVTKAIKAATDRILNASGRTHSQGSIEFVLATMSILAEDVAEACYRAERRTKETTHA